jgi:hypothetical protein
MLISNSCAPVCVLLWRLFSGNFCKLPNKNFIGEAWALKVHMVATIRYCKNFSVVKAGFLEQVAGLVHLLLVHLRARRTLWGRWERVRGRGGKEKQR